MHLNKSILWMAVFLSIPNISFAENAVQAVSEKIVVANSPRLAQSEQDSFAYMKQAAEQGNATAQFQLAAMYQDGRGVEKNNKEAARYYNKAAKQGHAAAQFHLACLHEQEGTLQDYKQAEKWYRKAGEQGYSVKYLAAMYMEGRGVKQNTATAFELFKTSAEAGDIDSQYQLGKMYITGQGAQQSDDQAVFWLQKAARHGHGDARLLLESMQH